MPFPEYSTREQWIEAARAAAQWTANATGLERFRIPMPVVLAVLDAEAAGADSHGLSSLSAERVAEASGASLRTVRLIRAGLANSGLLSHTSSPAPLLQLQLPRGTAAATARAGSLEAQTRDWLLDADPAVRWQVERDLLHEPEPVWRATRARVAREGYGAALLARQDDDGQWAGGAFFPAGFFGSPEAEEPGQPWTATTWTLNDLREWGIDGADLGDTAARLARNSRWEYDDLPYWGGEVDVCINSYTLANGAWLGADVSALARWFPEHLLDDGGWNCEAEEGDSVRSSFHSTLNAVRGILSYERATGDTSLREARHSGEEYLLRRRLLYRESTGERVGPFVDRFVYPSRHRYSALTALDHFREVSLVEGGDPDERIADAVALVRAARRPDGTWLQGAALPGRTWFPVDAAEGEPSRWLTLVGTRVLEWAEPA